MKERKKKCQQATHTHLCANKHIQNSHIIIIIMSVQFGGSRSVLAKLATIRRTQTRHTDIYILELELK